MIDQVVIVSTQSSPPNGARRNNVNVAFAEISSVDNAVKLNTPSYQVVELEHRFEMTRTAVTPYILHARS